MAVTTTAANTYSFQLLEGAAGGSKAGRAADMGRLVGGFQQGISSKSWNTPCHSERSEESSEITQRGLALSSWILHFVQNDKRNLRIRHGARYDLARSNAASVAKAKKQKRGEKREDNQRHTDDDHREQVLAAFPWLGCAEVLIALGERDELVVVELAFHVGRGLVALLGI